MANTTTVIPTATFFDELTIAARSLIAAGKELMKITRSLQKQVIDPSQAWFWTKEWQEAERQAEEDIKAGRTYELKSVGDLDKPFEELFGKGK